MNNQDNFIDPREVKVIFCKYEAGIREYDKNLKTIGYVHNLCTKFTNNILLDYNGRLIYEELDEDFVDGIDLIKRILDLLRKNLQHEYLRSTRSMKEIKIREDSFGYVSVKITFNDFEDIILSVERYVPPEYKLVEISPGLIPKVVV